MSIRTRIGRGLTAGLLIMAPMIALAPSASAALCPEDDPDCNITIEGEDGYVGITTLSGDLGGEPIDLDGLDPSVINEDGEFDRSHLARDVDSVDGAELGGEDGYQGITQIDGSIDIEPISGDLDSDGFPVWGWVLIGVGVVAAGGATVVGLRNRSAAAA